MLSLLLFLFFLNVSVYFADFYKLCWFCNEVKSSSLDNAKRHIWKVFFYCYIPVWWADFNSRKRWWVLKCVFPNRSWYEKYECKVLVSIQDADVMFLRASIWWKFIYSKTATWITKAEALDINHNSVLYIFYPSLKLNYLFITT